MPVTTRDVDRDLSIPPEGQKGIGCALGLSRREVEVLQCVVGDNHEREIATTLGLSRHTIRTYLKRLRAKLGVGGRVQSVKKVFAKYAAWLQSPSQSVAPMGDLHHCD
jgi:DNA-binding CsgD family transcriptional regulator